MKAFQKILVLVALIISAVLFVSAVATAANPIVTISKTGSPKKVSVTIDKLSAPASVWVINDQDVVLLEEKTTGEKFAKVLNLENLPTGAYKVIVTTDRKEIVQPLVLSNTDLALNEAAREEHYSPFFNAKEGGIVDIMLLNNRLQDVNVTILDAAGATVYEDDFDNVLKVEKRYRLNDLGEGSYTMCVTTPYKKYYKAVAIK